MAARDRGWEGVGGCSGWGAVVMVFWGVSFVLFVFHFGVWCARGGRGFSGWVAAGADGRADVTHFVLVYLREGGGEMGRTMNTNI